MVSGGPRFGGEKEIIALEIMDEVLELIDASNGLGVTINQGADATGMKYADFYHRVKGLEWLGKIRVVRGAGNYLRIVHADDPRLDECRLHTHWQQKIIDWMSEHADRRGLIHASLKEISKGIGHPSNCYGSIMALECRGFLEILDRGNSKRPRLYQVFKDGDGPKGHSAVWLSGNQNGQPLYMLFTKEEDNADSV